MLDHFRVLLDVFIKNPWLRLFSITVNKKFSFERHGVMGKKAHLAFCQVSLLEALLILPATLG